MPHESIKGGAFDLDSWRTQDRPTNGSLFRWKDQAVTILAVVAFAAVIVYCATAIYRAEKNHRGVWRQEDDDAS